MEYWPVFSSHGDGRKTHLTNDYGGETLCKVGSRYPWLLLTLGTTMDEAITDIRAVPDPDGRLCGTCRRIANRIG